MFEDICKTTAKPTPKVRQVRQKKVEMRKQGWCKKRKLRRKLNNEKRQEGKKKNNKRSTSSKKRV